MRAPLPGSPHRHRTRSALAKELHRRLVTLWTLPNGSRALVHVTNSPSGRTAEKPTEPTVVLFSSSDERNQIHWGHRLGLCGFQHGTERSWMLNLRLDSSPGLFART